jgi:type II secretory pathway pseudopilin PulG
MKSKILQSGASRFDFAISISIIAILASVLLFSLSRAQNQAEAVAMETDLTNMRWGLRELWAHRNATGQSLAGSEIDNANPLRLLGDQPKNYSGEYDRTPQDVQSAWYFDTKAKRLVYVFSDGQQVRFRLTSTAPLNQASRGMMGGIDLVLDQ